MAQKALLPGYRRLPGKSARMVTPEGVEISQRQYRKIVREQSGMTPIIGGKKITSNEALAKFNRENNLAAQLARPARGRTGLKKLDKSEAEKIAAKRAEEKLAAEKEKREAEAAQKIINTRNKKIAKATGKKAKKFSLNSLRPGRLAFQTTFYSYAEMQELIKDARKSGKVLAFALGINGVDERDGKDLHAMLTGLYDISYKFSEEKFDELSEDFIDGHAYFVFLSWFLHLSFKADYASAKANRAGLKLGQRPKKKRK